ncbi:hypothetical protein [Blastopirellula marina]|uniref:Uncharacterized protein n=1 Tax=Blastopirellula marina DSM 3645 TaxID=314230 RepID=A3ZUB9_9BACT|nr:hypothetical protein [Blastopirellula marina]EAQ79822.1 hypothetical protein DSM3645_21819 [Blastopirellula marina DSM 3645]
MSRAQARRQGVEISLFPFLAVLICTVGALIVLLVVLVQQARASVDAAPVTTETTPVAAPEVPAFPLAELEELRKLRAEQRQQLEDERLQLSGIEDHIRRLATQIRGLDEQVKLLEEKRNATKSDQADIDQQLAEVRQQLADAKDKLTEEQAKAAKKKPSYALIPYDGPNGTRRQPIYIECTGDRVILQPEGIELYGADFRPPLGAGNPLDAALRAIREYRLKQNPSAPDPYPLLVVRPNGAESYAAARDAMLSWDSEFGYELIDDELELQFPEADPFLAQTLMQTVEVARRRKVAVMRAAPREYGRVEETGLLTATSRGGFVPSGGGNGGGRGEEGSPFGKNAFLEQGAPIGGQPGASSTMTGGSAGGPESYARSSTDGGKPFDRGAGGGSQQFDRTSSGGQGTMAASLPGGYQTQAQRNAQGPQLSGADGTDAMSVPAGSTDGKRGNPNGDSTISGGYGAQQQGPSPGGQQGGSSSNSGGAQMAPQSLANTRGRNWALPGQSARATGITRPIHVVVAADRIVIVPEKGSSKQPQVVLLQSDVRGGIDEFVSQVWSRIEDWGIAGRGIYWKPTLKVDVQPGAQQRFEELAALLNGSGLEVERN